jgi:hypothetical protein
MVRLLVQDAVDLDVQILKEKPAESGFRFNGRAP